MSGAAVMCNGCGWTYVLDVLFPGVLKAGLGNHKVIAGSGGLSPGFPLILHYLDTNLLALPTQTVSAIWLFTFCFCLLRFIALYQSI